METPDLFTYDDFRAFLLDWWTYHQGLEPGLSKSEMSRRLGLPNTRSYFTDVLAGKRVTDLFLDRFCQALGLRVEEDRYFRALVQFQQAETPEDREVALDRLVVLSRSPRRRLDPRQYAYYRHWWNGALRAVLAIEDHSEDWECLASRIQPGITARQARESVALMQELGLIERDARGFWKPTEANLSSGTGANDELILQMQMQQFDLARRAIMTKFTLPKDIATSTLHLSGACVDRSRDRIETFLGELRSLATKDPDPADRIYSLCLAFFPLSSEGSTP
ncbi:MAG: TIGR02147 family protein [Fibrobacteria bacterium]|nr:TIGR02147 family protein [Fibrobacteria bacterium]